MEGVFGDVGEKNHVCYALNVLCCCRLNQEIRRWRSRERTLCAEGSAGDLSFSQIATVTFPRVSWSRASIKDLARWGFGFQSHRGRFQLLAWDAASPWLVLCADAPALLACMDPA